MKVKEPAKEPDELRMSAQAFDQIMGAALQVAPEETTTAPPKRAGKRRAAR